MGKRVLIICYSFPPHPGIGGRRWVKFAKYLKKRGYEINIISSENPFSDSQSEWLKDADGLLVHKLPLNYPKSLITYPSGIVDKIKYQIALLKVKFLGKGNYYDRTLFWKKAILKKSTEIIIKENIQNVIVSGAPFHLLYHASKLKQIHTNINLIVDFRDFWTIDTSLSPFATFSQKRKMEELKREQYVCNAADKIICVSEEMSTYFNKVANKKKAYTIPNGYDKEDLLEINTEKKTNKKTISFVFTGNLYNNIDNVFKPFCNAIIDVKNMYPELYKRLEFNFFGNHSHAHRQYVIKNNLYCITFHNAIPLKSTLEEINNSDYCMLFLNDIYAFSLSTKFYEYILLKKEIVLFSQWGKASEYIVENKLGYWIKPDDTLKDLLQLIRDHESGTQATRSEKFDYTQFSIEKIIPRLEELLI